MRRLMDFGLGAWEHESFGVQEAQRWFQIVKVGDPLVGKMLMKAAKGEYPNLNKNMNAFIRTFIESKHGEDNEKIQLFFRNLVRETVKMIRLDLLNLEEGRFLVNFAPKDSVDDIVERLRIIRPRWNLTILFK